MDCLIHRLVVSALLCSLCVCQMMEHRIASMMENAIDKIDALSLNVDGLHERMTTMEGRVVQISAKQDTLESSMETFKTDQNFIANTISKLAGRDQVTELQKQCSAEQDLMRETLSMLAREDRVAELHGTLSRELQEIKGSVQSCSSKDQLSEFEQVFRRDQCAGDHKCSDKAVCSNDCLGYKCTCLPGYLGDGFNCQDINECESDVPRCHQRAICNNYEGGYNCQCLPYYTGDGHNKCTAALCESPAKIIDGLDCVIPVIERMGWKQARDNCHRQGLRLLEGLANREQLLLLSTHFEDFLSFTNLYHDVWMGIHQSHWVEGSSTGVPSGFWAHGQPTGHPQDCGYIALQGPSLWDAECDIHKMPSLCQLLKD